MRTRVCRCIQSPDANEGALGNSNYSTERSPRTALLFVAKRNILLPFIRLEDEVVPRECLSKGDRKIVQCSFRGR